MKTKLFLAFAAVLFAAITIFHLNLAQQKAADDITLAGVEMVAGADNENPGGGGDTNPCTSTTRCNPGFGDFGTHTGEILCCQTATIRGNARAGTVPIW